MPQEGHSKLVITWLTAPRKCVWCSFSPVSRSHSSISIMGNLWLAAECQVCDNNCYFSASACHVLVYQQTPPSMRGSWAKALQASPSSVLPSSRSIEVFRNVKYFHRVNCYVQEFNLLSWFPRNNNNCYEIEQATLAILCNRLNVIIWRTLKESSALDQQ